VPRLDQFVGLIGGFVTVKCYGRWMSGIPKREHKGIYTKKKINKIDKIELNN